MDKTKIFVMWLDGFLTAIDGNLTQNQTAQIRERLNNLFEHEAEEPKAKLLIEEPVSQNFGPIRPSENGVVMRC